MKGCGASLLASKAPVVYLIDTSAIIDARDLHYRFGPRQPFWLWLARQIDVGKVVVIEQVCDEIAVGNDELAEWIAGFAEQARIEPPSYPSHLREMEEWILANYPKDAYRLFTDVSKRGRKSADPYLISHALHQREQGLEEHAVVTQEVPSFPGGKVKIPDVCRRFGVRCITLSEMLAEAGVDFAKDMD